MLDRCDVIARFEQTGLRSGIQPGHTATKQFHLKLVPFQIEQIQIGDLQFAARRGFQAPAKIDNFRVVYVKTWNGELRLGLLRFFLEADRAAVAIELDHAVTFGIANLIAENARAFFKCERVTKEIEFTVEDVVTKD